MEFEDCYRFVDLSHTSEDELTTTLPPILAANKQLLAEAGGYFFSHGEITCLTSGYRTKKLLAWLKLNGRGNCNRLKKCNIRFALRPSQSTQEEREWTKSISRVFSFSDASHLVGMAAEIARLVVRYPALHRWHFQTQQKYDCAFQELPDVLLTWQTRTFRFQSIPISSFDRLRAIVRRLLAVDGELHAEENIAEGVSVRHWNKTSVRRPRQYTHKVVARSGRTVYIDMRAWEHDVGRYFPMTAWICITRLEEPKLITMQKV